jgi:hypothetical protein
MWNPFKRNRVVLTVEQVTDVLVNKEAQLIIARQQIQNAVQIIGQLKAKIAEFESSAPKKENN